MPGSGLTSPTHLLLLLLIALLFFGGKRLPEIGRSLGSGMREFKSSLTQSAPTETPDSTSDQVSSTPTESAHSSEN